jgi:CMP/dCMP kinase
LKNRRKILKVAIDSESSSGGGTQAKLISKHYNLFYLDTGKIYRLIANIKIKNPKNFNHQFLKKKVKNLKISYLQNKSLLSEEVGLEASIIAKKKNIRKLVHNYQISAAYNPPRKYNGSCLDGRDCTYKIVPDADFKFFITAPIKVRAKRRYLELKKLDNKTKFSDVLKSIKTRDWSDYNRSISPLKRTKKQILINSGKLSKRACFLKIKHIMDRKIKA